MTALIVVCVAGGWIGAGIVAIAFAPRAATRHRRRADGGGRVHGARHARLDSGRRHGLAAHAGGLRRSRSRSTSRSARLLPLGIGNYAPSLVVFSLLGMDPEAAFPIMMGSGAFVATIAGVRFVGAAASTSGRRSG